MTCILKIKEDELFQIFIFAISLSRKTVSSNDYLVKHFENKNQDPK